MDEDPKSPTKRRPSHRLTVKLFKMEIGAMNMEPKYNGREHIPDQEARAAFLSPSPRFPTRAEIPPQLEAIVLEAPVQAAWPTDDIPVVTLESTLVKVESVRLDRLEAMLAAELS